MHTYMSLLCRLGNKYVTTRGIFGNLFSSQIYIVYPQISISPDWEKVLSPIYQTSIWCAIFKQRISGQHHNPCYHVGKAVFIVHCSCVAVSSSGRISVSVPILHCGTARKWTWGAVHCVELWQISNRYCSCVAVDYESTFSPLHSLHAVDDGKSCNPPLVFDQNILL